MHSLEYIDSQALSVFKRMYKSLNWKEEFNLNTDFIPGLVPLDQSMDYKTKQL